MRRALLESMTPGKLWEVLGVLLLAGGAVWLWGWPGSLMATGLVMMLDGVEEQRREHEHRNYVRRRSWAGS